MMKELIDIIKQFEGNKAKFYWINKLNISDTIKGRLIIYFNLLTGE